MYRLWVPCHFHLRLVANAQYEEDSPLIGGVPPFEYRTDARYSDSNADAWARYYAQGGTDPAGAVYFRSVPGIKEETIESQPEMSAVTTEVSVVGISAWISC